MNNYVRMYKFMATAVEKILSLRDWSKIGTRQHPRRKIDKGKLAQLKRRVGTFALNRGTVLCRGARGSNKNGKAGALTFPALWFAGGSALCEVENREKVYFYKLERHVMLLDLREKNKQRGFMKAAVAFSLLADGKSEYQFIRDDIVPLMIYRKLDQLGVHGWIAYDDNDELEILLLNPSDLLAHKFTGKPHTRLPLKKRTLHKTATW